jgi:uncharacterized phage protein gp47/JayE
MLGRVSDEWRKDPGDFIYDAVAASPAEIVALQQGQDEILKQSFAQYATGDKLDLKLAEIGLTRIEAVAAKRRLTIDATAGVTIPKGHTATTVTLVSEGNPLQYTVDEAVSFPTAGTQDIIITCKIAGKIGSDVLVGSDFLLLPPIPGIKTITDKGVEVPGQDRESDEDAYARYDFKVKHPDTGGNKNDYIRWIEPLDGVGKLKVIPRYNGNGTVKVVLVGDDYLPATQEVVSTVQAFIDPKFTPTTVEAETMTKGGYGVSDDAMLVNDSGTSVKFVYNATGAGLLTFGTLNTLENLLTTEGEFIATVAAQVNSIAGAADLLQVTVQDQITKVPLAANRNGTGTARITKKANQFTGAGTVTAFPLQFYWDGEQDIEIEVRRLTTDTTTTLWVDKIDYTSVAGLGLGYGKAPGGARVLAVPATDLAINIAATVTYSTGAVIADVQAAFAAALEAYRKTLIDQWATGQEISIVYARIGGLLINTPGISNYTGLMINGGTADISLTADQIPVSGTVTI